MQGYRKVILGLAFIGGATFLAWTGIRAGTDLVGLSTVVLTMSTGLGVVVYGNVKEHQANGR